MVPKIRKTLKWAAFHWYCQPINSLCPKLQIDRDDIFPSLLRNTNIAYIFNMNKRLSCSRFFIFWDARIGNYQDIEWYILLQTFKLHLSYMTQGLYVNLQMKHFNLPCNGNVLSNCNAVGSEVFIIHIRDVMSIKMIMSGACSGVCLPNRKGGFRTLKIGGR